MIGATACCELFQKPICTEQRYCQRSNAVLFSELKKMAVRAGECRMAQAVRRLYAVAPYRYLGTIAWCEQKSVQLQKQRT
jgi:hypothetical protein